MASAGERVGVEALTYPVVKGIAARLGIVLVPIALEDAVYAYLVDDAPLAALAPDRTILVDSLSKRVAPGLTLGLVAAPGPLAERVVAALRSGAWAASGFPLAAGLQMMRDGTADRIAQAKRADVAARQAVARAALDGQRVGGDLRAYHLWLELPEGWRAETFTAAARRGIAVVPGSAFAVAPGHAPNGIRLALAAPPHETLADAVAVIGRLAAGTVPDADFE